MRAVMLLGALMASMALGLELSQGDWDDMTAGKAVFLKFFTPWCGQCEGMKTAWDALMEEYKDDDTVLVAEVDCVGTGKAKCKEIGIKAYPEVKYGDPNNLEAYTGDRDLPSLQKLVQELTPTWGPERFECDNKRRRQVEGYMDLPPSEENASVKTQAPEGFKGRRRHEEMKHQEIRFDVLGAIADLSDWQFVFGSDLDVMEEACERGRAAAERIQAAFHGRMVREQQVQRQRDLDEKTASSAEAQATRF